MTGSSDNNRSERQSERREVNLLKEACSKGTVAGTRTDKKAEVRAMSVLRNAKSKRHRKTHPVRSGDTGRAFMHLTRGDLLSESAGEVSRDHSSEENRRKVGRAKGRRTKREQSTDELRWNERAAPRNRAGLATTADSREAGEQAGWWTQPDLKPGGASSTPSETEVAEDAQ